MALSKKTKNNPFKWLKPLLVIGLLIAALFLLGNGRNDGSVTHKVQTSLDGFFAPITHFISSPSRAISGMSEQLSEKWYAMNNSDELTQKAKDYQHVIYQLEALERENKALRRLSNYHSGQEGIYGESQTSDTPIITARIYGSILGPYDKTTLISAGIVDGVKKDMAAMNEDGLVGRVSLVNKANATLLLLTDISSRIAVITNDSGEHGMIKGTGGSLLELHYLPEDSKAKVGETIYSSGDGGFMPAKLLIGTIKEITSNRILVSPASNLARTEFVTLIKAKQ